MDGGLGAALTRRKTQWHKGPATCGLHLALPIRPPFPGKGRDPIVGPVKPQADQVRMQLLEGPLLLAGPVRFRLQPGSQSVRKGVKLARPMSSGSQGTFCSHIILPASSTTHTAVSNTDTSSPTK